MGSPDRRTTLLAALALPLALAVPRVATAGDASPDAEILLKKSFKPAPASVGTDAGRPSGGRGGNRRTNPAGVTSGSGGKARAPATLPQRAGTIAEALGEESWSSGALRFPLVDGGGVTIDSASNPVLAFNDGDKVILDPGGRLSGVAIEIESLWPDYRVLALPPGAGMRDLLGSLLGEAGYLSVLSSAPVTFGREATVRFTPDFVVMKDDDALLAGETRLVSVVPTQQDALPPELREMAREHRMLVVELLDSGDRADDAAASWHDRGGRLTTLEVWDPGLLLSTLAERLGLVVEHDVRIDVPGMTTTETATLRISRGDRSSLVFVRAPEPEIQRRILDGGADVIIAETTSEASAFVRHILVRFGFRGIGPAVEFYRPPASGGASRFLITVPGWLVNLGSRRLLITGATLEEPLRLFLAREGIEVFEYHCHVPAGR